MPYSSRCLHLWALASFCTSMTWFIGFAWCTGLHLQGLLLQYLLETKVFDSEVFLARTSLSSRLLSVEVFIFKAFLARRSSSPSLLSSRSSTSRPSWRGGLHLRAFSRAPGKKTSCFRVAGPPICSPSPSWPEFMTKSSVSLGVVDVVIVVEVDVWTRVANEPLESKWLTKVW